MVTDFTGVEIISINGKSAPTVKASPKKEAKAAEENAGNEAVAKRKLPLKNLQKRKQKKLNLQRKHQKQKNNTVSQKI